MTHDKYTEAAKYYKQLSELVDEVDTALFDKILKSVTSIMFNRDASLVSTSDETELNTVKNGFVKKHLGLEGEEAERVVASVAEKMSGIKFKYRAVFYYLLAKEAGTYK